MSQSGIYRIVNLVNDKFYIGSAVNLERRWYMHRNRLIAGKHRNAHLQAAWNKYGESAFQFRVVEFVKDRNGLIEREQAWLDCSYDEAFSYNICKVANSRLGVKARPETIEKMREAATGVLHTEEAKAKMSAAKIGIRLPTRSEEHRQKISEIHSGKVVSEETRQKLRDAHARSPRTHSEETRRKMSESIKAALAAKKQLNSTEGFNHV